MRGKKWLLQKTETKKEFLDRIQKNTRLTLTEEKLEDIWAAEQKRLRKRTNRLDILLDKQKL